MQIGNAASTATSAKLSRAGWTEDVAVGDRVDDRLEVGDVTLSQPGDLGPNGPVDGDARSGLRHLGERGRTTGRDARSRSARRAHTAARRRCGRRARRSATAVVSSRARHGSTGRSAGRNASTAVLAGDHRRGRAPCVRRRSARARWNAVARAASHWAPRLPIEELRPNHRAPGARTTRRLRPGPSDPSGRARTSSVVRFSNRTTASAAPVASSMRTPAVQTASDSGSVAHGSGSGRRRDRAEGWRSRRSSSAARRRRASGLSPSPTIRIVTTPTAIAPALTASHGSTDREPRRPGIIAALRAEVPERVDHEHRRAEREVADGRALDRAW